MDVIRTAFFVKAHYLQMQGRFRGWGDALFSSGILPLPTQRVPEIRPPANPSVFWQRDPEIFLKC